MFKGRININVGLTVAMLLLSLIPFYADGTLVLGWTLSSRHGQPWFYPIPMVTFLCSSWSGRYRERLQSLCVLILAVVVAVVATLSDADQL